MAANRSLETSLTYQSKKANTELSCRISFTEKVINTTLYVGGMQGSRVPVVAGIRRDRRWLDTDGPHDCCHIE